MYIQSTPMLVVRVALCSFMNMVKNMYGCGIVLLTQKEEGKSIHFWLSSENWKGLLRMNTCDFDVAH